MEISVKGVIKELEELAKDLNNCILSSTAMGKIREIARELADSRNELKP